MEPTSVLCEGQEPWQEAAVRLEVFYACVCVRGACVRLNPKHTRRRRLEFVFRLPLNSSGASTSPAPLFCLKKRCNTNNTLQTFLSTCEEDVSERTVQEGNSVLFSFPAPLPSHNDSLKFPFHLSSPSLISQVFILIPSTSCN